jgi:hypothetical protein
MYVVRYFATRGVLDSQLAVPAAVVCTHATWGGVRVATEFQFLAMAAVMLVMFTYNAMGVFE